MLAIAMVVIPVVLVIIGLVALVRFILKKLKR